MLVTVTEFEIDAEQMIYNQKDLHMMHGNKHLTTEQIKELKERGIPTKDLRVAKKRF